VPPGPPTIASALREGSRALRLAGVREPALEAERLLRHVLGWERSRLLASPEDVLDDRSREAYEALLAERARRRPLQHILGASHFWRQELLVTPDVLVPRPETEVLVEACLDLVRGMERPIVVDVGTGSGCIALALAAERPDATVHATDISEAALAVAGENARRLELRGRVEFHLGDLLEPVAASHGRIDLVVSNPPYVDASEIDALEPEVRDHDPRLALVPPGGDRYEIYSRLARQAATALRPGGHLAVEIGAGMAERVGALFETAGLIPAAPVPDLAGIARVMTARRPQARPRSQTPDGNGGLTPRSTLC